MSGYEIFFLPRSLIHSFIRSPVLSVILLLARSLTYALLHSLTQDELQIVDLQLNMSSLEEVFLQIAGDDEIDEGERGHRAASQQQIDVSAAHQANESLTPTIVEPNSKGTDATF